MEAYSEEEVFVCTSNVIPGYLYDKANRKFQPRDDGLSFEVKESPVRFEIEINRLSSLLKLSISEGESQWKIDFINENPAEAILIKGNKILEKVGLSITPHESKWTVTSVLYESYIDMLLTFKQELKGECIEKFKTYLQDILHGYSECFIPSDILEYSSKAFIYPNTISQGEKVMPSKHSFEEFCRILKDTKVNSFPFTGHIKRPISSLFTDNGEAFQRNSDINLKNDQVENDTQQLHDQQSHPESRDEGLIRPTNPSAEANYIGCLSSKTPANLDESHTKDIQITDNCSLKEELEPQQSPSFPVMEDSHGPKRTPDNSVNVPIVQRRVSEENEKEVKRSDKNEADEVEVISENTRQDDVDTQCLNSALGHTEHNKGTMQNQGAQENPLNHTFKDSVNQQEDVKERNHFQGNADNEQQGIGCSSRETKQDLKRKSMSNAPKKTNSNILDEQHSSKYNEEQEQISEDLYKTLRAKSERHKEKILQKSMKSTYLSPTQTINDPCGIQRKLYGEINENVSEKSIIFLGASGSGKTMLLNFIANFYMGKKKADDDLIHVETTSPTTSITAYTFYSSESETALTIIDTPGLNDSSGAEVRDHIQILKTFLANVSSKGFDIHAIGLVAQAHLVRLTSSERLVMDYVSTIFGQRVSENLLTLDTFADSQDTPPVIEAMNNYDVKFKLFVKFNNSTLSNNKTDKIDDLDKAYWRVCWKNWKKCLKTLSDLPALSVNTMKAVQNEVYAKMVKESAEKDLFGELNSFMSACKKENVLSKALSQNCEQIWEQAAVVHQMYHKQLAGAISRDEILIDFAANVCKKLEIPSQYICFLSLAPTGPLVTSGSEIIRTMELLEKQDQSNADKMCKSLTELSFCSYCKKEHKMEKVKHEKGFFQTKSQGHNILCLKCKECKCNADYHNVIPIQSPFHSDVLLKHTIKCIRDALNRYSLSGFIVPEKIFLKYLDEHLEYKYSKLIQGLLKM